MVHLLNISRSHEQSNNDDVPSSSNATSALPEFILKNCSLATVVQSDGGRRVFFQAPDGAIRQAIYSIATNNWISPTTVVNGANILKNTPISSSAIYNTTSVNGAPNVDGVSKPNFDSLRHVANCDYRYIYSTSIMTIISNFKLPVKASSKPSTLVSQQIRHYARQKNFQHSPR